MNNKSIAKTLYDIMEKVGKEARKKTLDEVWNEIENKAHKLSPCVGLEINEILEIFKNHD